MAAQGDGQDVPLPPGDDDFGDEAGGQPHVNAFPPPPPHQQQQQQQQFNPYAHQFFPWVPPFHMMPPPWAQQHVPQPPRVQEPRPDRVKLGSFLQSRPATWFNLAEAACNRNFVVQSRDIYFIVLSSLPDEVIKKLGAIADSPDGHVDPYLVLKNRVLQLYAPTVWEDLESLLHFKEMANLRPSALMTEMLTLLPAQEQPGMLFKALWLSRLPSDVRGHVQLQADTLDCIQLGEIADKAWLARTTGKSHAVAAVPDQPHVDDLTDTVAALNVGKPRSKRPQDKRKNKGTRAPPQQHQGQQERTRDLCSLHHKYGGKAHFCREPQTCLLADKVTGNASGQDW